MLRAAALIVLTACAAARGQAAPPTTLKDAEAQAAEKHKAAATSALAVVASGDPVEGFLAVDRALELDPTNTELMSARRSLEDRAVEVGMKRAATLRATGRLSSAIELLGPLAAATGDPRVAEAAKSARAELDARRAELLGRPGAAAPEAEGEHGIDPLERVDKRELDRRFENVLRRLDALDRRIELLAPGQFKGGAAEPQIDVLQRRAEETRRDLERMIGDVRREIDALSRDVQSLRRDVDRNRR